MPKPGWALKWLQTESGEYVKKVRGVIFPAGQLVETNNCPAATPKEKSHPPQMKYPSGPV